VAVGKVAITIAIKGKKYWRWRDVDQFDIVLHVLDKAGGIVALPRDQSTNCSESAASSPVY
jgi:hypothetical protein